MNIISQESTLDDISEETIVTFTIEDKGLVSKIITTESMVSSSGGINAWIEKFYVAIRANMVRNTMEKQQSLQDSYSGVCYVSYDVNGNVTRVDFNDYKGDGNNYLIKNMTFIPAKDVLLYPDKHLVMLNEYDEPDLYER